jgi:CBS domain-containing protein
MTVQSILKRKGADVVTIEQETAIESAAHRMRSSNIAALVVTKGDQVVGMLANRDIVDGLSCHGSRFSALRVADLMRLQFVTASPQDSVKHVMALMTRHRATHIPVFASNRLAGIVSIGDIVKHRLEELELEANALRDAYIAVH